MCGQKFDPSGPAGPPASDAEAAAFEKGTSSASTEVGQKRFFDDTTGKTDVERSQKLSAVAEAAMASAPPPSATPSSPAHKVEKNVDPVTRQPFEFRKDDLAKALAMAAKKEGKPVPDAEPADITAYYKAGATAGFERKTLEQALHDAAVERVDRRQAPPPGMEAPLTSELEAIRPSGKKVAAIAGAVVLGLVGLVVVLSSGGEDPPKEGTPTAEGKPAGTGETGTAAPTGDKPKRKAGQLDSKLIGPAIAAVADKARTCHEAARKANPKVAGKLVFDVELEEDGSFSRLDVKQDTVGDARMVDCVKNEVKTYAWPKPQGGFFAMEFPLGFDVAEKSAPKGGGKKKGR